MLKTTNTLVAEFVYVSAYDPAVIDDEDALKEIWPRYIDGLADVPLKPGETPTYFTLRHLNELERRRVTQQLQVGGSDAGAIAACAIGLLSAVGLDEAGKTYKFNREIDTAWLHPLSLVTLTEMAKLPSGVAIDLGNRIILASFPRPN